MGKTLIDVDRELLALAQQILGTATLKDTVNGALREVVRRWAVVEFGVLARSGIFRRRDDCAAEAAARPAPVESA